MNYDTGKISEGLKQGNRNALAKAITLAESDKPMDRNMIREILDSYLKERKTALNLGITGPPGVGKSTLIEKLGMEFIQQGLKPAVLTVDPTSMKTQGSILGDKTRMGLLSQEAKAYIRSSPSGKSQSGLNQFSFETMLLCEAASFDPVIIETVGIGQSELAIFDLADISLLLIQPAGGDDLQAIKKGSMEWADFYVVTKADGILSQAAQKTADDLQQSLGHHEFLNHDHRVITCSVEDKTSIQTLATRIQTYWDILQKSGRLEHLRALREARHFLKNWQFDLKNFVEAHPVYSNNIQQIVKKIEISEINSHQGFDLLRKIIFATSK